MTYGASTFPAVEVARGAAYELFSAYPVDGFQRNPRGGDGAGWHRFVHTSDITATHGPTADHSGEVADSPVQVPLSRVRGWADVHRMTQSAARADDPTIATIRRTATVRRGTRMVKILSPRQFAGHLVKGWLPGGFCHREYDIAHLRTPAELRLLRTDNPPAGGEPEEVAFALRWRAVDPYDYTIPSASTLPGLVAMSPHDRIGPPVLGTGFTPSEHHIIPEFVTTDLADLPLTAHATLAAYTPDGTEVVLYMYQPEQRGWTRMVGPQWRHLLAWVPDVSPDQEYVPMPPRGESTRLVGWLRGREYDAVADPPAEFRVRSMARTARYPVEALVRRTGYAVWRGARCTVLREESGWLRLRLCQPSPEHVLAPAASCVERGMYELWAPATEVTDRQTLDVRYAI